MTPPLEFASAIEFALDWIVVILSLVVFFVFYVNLNKFVGGEAKRIFNFLTIFLGIFFLSLLVVDGLDITHFLTLHKGPITEELKDSARVISHIFQIIGLGVLFYASVIFMNFAKRLEKERL